MAAYVKYQIGTEVLAEGANAGTDSWRLILSNTAPNVATDTTAVSATELSTGGGSVRPYRYLSLPAQEKRKKRNDYDEDELKRLILEAEQRDKEEIEVLEKKSEELYREGVKIAEIKNSIASIQEEMEKRSRKQILFNIELKIKLLEAQRRKNMALLLLMSAA